MKSSSAKPSICFVAHRAYGALAGVDNGHAGGVERQQAMMARWLAQRGWRVVMLTWDEGQQDGDVIDGVTVRTICRRDAGLKGIRFLHPRWTGLWRAMRRADADMYYYNLGDMGLGQVAAWCRRHGRKCVYSVASNPDCDPSLPVLKPLRERVLYRYGLRHADRVIVQTKTQQRMLEEGFGLRSEIIPMPCFMEAGEPKSIREAGGDAGSSSRVLWIGRFSAEKRLEWLLDIAERSAAGGKLTFDVVGDANVQTEYAKELVRRASALPNVRLHGRLPWESVLSLYRGALALCCTSAYEGFPNTFLEAWAQGVPVVTPFDPDGCVAAHQLGLCAADVEGLAAALFRLQDDRALWQKLSENARSHFLDHHRPEEVVPRVEAVFAELVRRGAGYGNARGEDNTTAQVGRNAPSALRPAHAGRESAV